MFVAKVKAPYTYTDKFKLFHKGIRETTQGRLANGNTIVVDNFRDDKGKIIEKMFVVFNDTMQRIVSKTRNEKGGFNKIG